MDQLLQTYYYLTEGKNARKYNTLGITSGAVIPNVLLGKLKGSLSRKYQSTVKLTQVNVMSEYDDMYVDSLSNNLFRYRMVLIIFRHFFY